MDRPDLFAEATAGAAVMYAALHGVNIPGDLWLTEAKIRVGLQVPLTRARVQSTG